MKRRILRAILLTIMLLTPVAALAQDLAPPNDPNFGEQWALDHIGATCAWQHTSGAADVTVAVIDSGVDLHHPDLVGRLRDDGRDFVDGDDDPSDENGHGTNVTGIIAATLDNGEGIAGVAPGVMILPVRVMNAKGYGSDRTIARGVRYAADKGVKVINLSLGATLTIGADSESKDVEAAISYAQEKGALVVVAAGNDFVPLPNAITVNNSDVLIVAATDQDDVKADFSNSGPWVSVTAPGVHILSTMPTYDVYLTSEAVPRDERFQQNYDYMSGTSQATPFVSGLAGLLFSEHPDWSANQVAEEIKQRAADISARNPRLTAKGWLGSGRIDACQTLGGQIAPVVPVAPAAPVLPVSPVAIPRSTDALIIIGVLACGAVLLLAVLLFVLIRAVRRPAPAPAAAMPIYTPPPIASYSATPAAPYQAAPPAPITRPDPAFSSTWATLTVIAGPAQARSYLLAGAEALIGRGDDCAVLLIGDGTVSRRHALVRNDGRQVTVEDCGSTHGSYLGGQRLTAPTPVRRGDVLQIGQTLLRFE